MVRGCWEEKELRMAECLGHEDHQCARHNQNAKEDESKAMDKEDKVERGVDMVNQGQEGDCEGDGQGLGQGQEGKGQDEGDEDDGWEDNQGMDQDHEDGEGHEAKEGNGEVVVEGKGQQGKAERPAALAAAAPYKMDKGGNPMVGGGAVTCYASKNKDKYVNRKGQGRALEHKGGGGPNALRPGSGREAQGGIQGARGLDSQ